MALFEGYERRIGQITPVLAKFGIASVEAARDVCKEKGLYRLRRAATDAALCR